MMDLVIVGLVIGVLALLALGKLFVWVLIFPLRHPFISLIIIIAIVVAAKQ